MRENCTQSFGLPSVAVTSERVKLVRIMPCRNHAEGPSAVVLYPRMTANGRAPTTWRYFTYADRLPSAQNALCSKIGRTEGPHENS